MFYYSNTKRQKEIWYLYKESKYLIVLDKRAIWKSCIIWKAWKYKNPEAELGFFSEGMCNSKSVNIKQMWAFLYNKIMYIPTMWKGERPVHHDINKPLQSVKSRPYLRSWQEKTNFHDRSNANYWQFWPGLELTCPKVLFLAQMSMCLLKFLKKADWSLFCQRRNWLAWLFQNYFWK